MKSNNEKQAVLFADIAGSTAIYGLLGDQRAQTLIGSCLSLLSKIARKYNGSVIKTIGDEVLCTFPEAKDAVLAAKEMNQVLAAASVVDEPGYPPPNIYVGIHFGPVIHEKGDIFGDTVNVAARIVGFKKQRQILISEQVAAGLPDGLRDSVKRIGKAIIRGKCEEFNIYEFIWEAQDVTIIMNHPLENLYTREKSDKKLELTVFNQTVVLGPDMPFATLGRQAHNHIVVNTQFASRSHARIEFRNGKFFLMDQSSNGTYLRVGNAAQDILVKQEEMQISGSGMICLGRPTASGQPDTLRYRML